jgi:antibiotic biosynthesis monooxygenase (ABM) superfamily enzyme
MSFFKNLLGSGSQEFTKVENDQKFNLMLQQMQGNRWKITLIILLTFFFIIFGIVLSVMFKAEIQESWKELLLLLLGAFVGNLNKVIDFWFSNEDRDKMLVQKMDEEDNTAKPALEGWQEPSTEEPTEEIG